jgi:glutathione peroxidase
MWQDFFPCTYFPVITRFTCFQFKQQEPGDRKEISSFVQARAPGLTLFDKIDVNGASSHQLYTFLKDHTGGEEISWNFEKFLLDGAGRVVKRYPPRQDPKTLWPDVDVLLTTTHTRAAAPTTCSDQNAEATQHQRRKS